MYPLELHLVHYSCDYYTLSEAINAYANGSISQTQDNKHVLAVIAILFEIGEANPVLNQILDDIIIDGIREYSTNHMMHH